MDRKNEKTLVALGEEELSAVAGGAPTALSGPLSTALAVDASQHVNTGVIVGVQVPITIAVGGDASSAGTGFAGFIGQFGGQFGM
jgi:hypothetical protein